MPIKLFTLKLFHTHRLPNFTNTLTLHLGKEIKKLMPMIVKGSQICEECTPQQLEIINKIINHLKTNYPAEWAEGVEKFGAPAHA